VEHTHSLQPRFSRLPHIFAAYVPRIPANPARLQQLQAKTHKHIKRLRLATV
jgi:hypothetical protein